jgi:hypothetical protein
MSAVDSRVLEFRVADPSEVSTLTRDAPDTVFAGYPLSSLPDIRVIQKPDTEYPAGYTVRAGYRISGRILGLKTIFLIKYQMNL